MPQRTSTSMNWRLRQQKYRLVSSKCKSCNTVHFPARVMCPDCNSETQEHMLSGNGEIVSFTHIHTAPEGFDTPYTIAIIKLEEGPTISAAVVGEKGNIEIGKKVHMVFRKLYEDGCSGLIHYGFKFEVTE